MYQFYTRVMLMLEVLGVMLATISCQADAPSIRLPEGPHIGITGPLDDERFQSHREGFITCRVPLAKGFCEDSAELCLVNSGGQPEPLQA